jgi:hypothetical protein
VSNDAKFKARIDSATAQARRVVRERQLSTKLWNGATAARDILRRADPYRLLHHAVAVGFVGHVLFRRGWLISALPVILQSSNASCFAIYAASSLLPRLVPARDAVVLALPRWAYVLMALAAVVPQMRERIGQASRTFNRELAQQLSTWDELGRTHSLFACVAKKKGMATSQRECIDLLACSMVWWVASTIAMRCFERM